MTATATTLPAAKAAEVERGANIGIRYAIIAVAVVWAVQCAKELWRMYRPRV